MFELQKVGVQRLTRKRGYDGCRLGRKCVGLRLVGGPVIAITDQRMSDMGQMNTDLMGSTRLKTALQQRRHSLSITIIGGANRVVCDRMARIGRSGRFDGAFRPIGPCPPKRRVDCAFRRRRLSPDQRVIGALQRARPAMIGKLRGQMPMGAVVLGDNHDTACVLVQPVNNAWPSHAADAR